MNATQLCSSNPLAKYLLATKELVGLCKKERFGVHDLRRTCAKLCRKSGGDLEQIKFLRGHSFIQTIERYLGSQQEIAIAVNDFRVLKRVPPGR